MMRVVFCFLFVGFFQTAAAEKKPDFNSIMQLKLGSSTKDDVIKLFGQPEIRSERIKEGTKEAYAEVWEYSKEYLDERLPRLYVFFPLGKSNLYAWNWNVYSGEPELDLKTVLKKFSGASWIGETTEWINPHAFPMECFYRDKASGITIRYNEYRKEVESISQTDPSRTISSNQEQKPPRFCISTFCSDGVPAKEWVATAAGPICPVPK